MKTHVATSLAHGSSMQAVVSLSADLREKLAGSSPVLLLAFASTKQSLPEVTGGLKREFPGARVLGASTAGEFTEAGDAKGSVSVFALAGDFKVHVGMGTGLKESAEDAVGHAVALLPRELPGYAHRTAIVLLDPLAGNGEEASLLLAASLGADVAMAGGAAGDDLQMSATHVAVDGQAATNALVVALLFSKEKPGIGVAHGHRALSPPLKVTRASGGTVYEVNDRPAWDVWVEQTRASAAAAGFAELSKDREGAFLLKYEAGLSIGEDYKIRAPLSRNADGSINFACGIEEGSVIRITESVPERQVESAREAACRARLALDGKKAAGAVVFDCICRNLILQDRFAHAVQAISEELGGVPVAGFETYGEIALEVGEMSGFHNTTSVVLAFPAES
jgi:methyl-accepting chemotaxis protein